MVASGSQRSFVLPACTALFALASTSSAGDVFVVSPSGSYTQIQSAIDAASDYDTILVKPHPSASTHYDGFVVNGKSLAIVGQPHSGLLVRVRGEMRIEATPADGLVVLGSLYGVGAWSPSGGAAVRSMANTGPVRIEDCQLLGSTWPAVSIDADANTQFVSTDVTGGSQTWGGVWAQFDERYGLGVHSTASTVRLFDCNVTGSDGGTQGSPDPKVGLLYGGHAGDALQVVEGLVFAAGSTFRGGDGGQGSLAACPFECCADGGNGGDGIVIGDTRARGGVTSDVFTLTCAMQAGLAGDGGVHLCAGSDGQAGVAVRELASGDWHPFANGIARYLSGNPYAAELSSVGLVATGAPGDRVYARIEVVHPVHAFPTGTASHSPIAYSPKSRVVYLGTIPASGSLAASVPTGFLPFAVKSEWWRFHSMFVLPSGVVVEGNDFVAAVIDWI
jgi:hypothetical protein